MKNILKSVLISTFLSLGLTACASPVVRYLESYDQLTAFKGSDELYFVRDAAGAHSPYGDPTVREGWAVYNWDAGTASWKQLTRQDVIVLGNYNLDAFVTKQVYSMEVIPLKNSVSNLAVNLERSVTELRSYTDATVASSVMTAETRINAKIENDVAIVLDDAKAYTDSKIVGIYRFKGKCLFSALPITGMSNGDAWFVTDRNSTYVWFADDHVWISLGATIDLSLYKTWAETEPIIDSKIAVVDMKADGLIDAIRILNTNVEGATTTANDANRTALTAYDKADTALEKIGDLGSDSVKSYVDSSISSVDTRISIQAETIRAVQGVATNAQIAADDANRTALSAYDKADTALGKFGDLGDLTVKNYVDTKAQAVVDSHVTDTASWAVSEGEFNFTEHPVQLTLAEDAVITPTGDWPNAKPVFVRVVPTGNYSLADNIKFVGYGTLPTSAYHCLIWKVGMVFYFNVLVVE